MNVNKLRVISSFFLVLFSTFAVAGGVDSWSIIPSLDHPTNKSSTFTSVSVLFPSDVWAVGKTGNNLNPDGSIGVPLIEHFDGTRWNSISAEIPANFTVVELNDIEAISTNNVWAVGSLSNVANLVNHTLIQNWNGTKWSIVPTPDLPAGAYLGKLSAVSAVRNNPNDVWAVGSYLIGGTQHSIVLHWDGITWSNVDLPASIVNEGLYDVVALSATNIWAVGDNQSNKAFIAHYDGTTWTPFISDPVFPASQVYLNSISAVSPNDIWVSGLAIGNVANPLAPAPYIGHWDGQSWSNVTSTFLVDQPYSPTFVGFKIDGVTAIETDDVWVYGYKTEPVNGFQVTLQHWDGRMWTESQIEQPTGSGRILDMGVAGRFMMGVGSTLHSNSQETLVEIYRA